MHTCKHTWIQKVAICKYILVYISNISNICCINCISFNFVLPKLHFETAKLDIKKVWIVPVFHSFLQGTPDSRPTFAVVVPDFQWQIPCCASGWYTACRSQWLLTLEKKAKKNEAKREKNITFKWDSDTPDWSKLYGSVDISASNFKLLINQRSWNFHVSPYLR